MRTRFGLAVLAFAALAVSPLPPPLEARQSPVFAARNKSYLNDLFDGTALSPAWTILHPNLAQVSVSGGALHLQPTQDGPNATWFNDGESVLVYKSVTGDFTATTIAHARDPQNGTQPPPLQYRLGGLTVRDPNSTAPGQHNWAHVAIGAGAGSVAVEDKTTTGSVSDFLLYPTPNADAELRITRQGSLISLYWRPIGAQSWTLLRTHSHPEFPATVQVGLMVYSYQTPPSIRADFDEIRFL